MIGKYLKQYTYYIEMRINKILRSYYNTYVHKTNLYF